MLISIIKVLISLVGLYFGADWLIKGAASLAARLGISPLVIGCTVVAFGTSAPELVVSINATFAGAGGIAVGNVVGSNIFNIAVILGISAILNPLNVNRQLIRFDIPIMLAASFLFLLFFIDYKIGRIEGLIFTTGIIAYIYYNIQISRKQNKKAIDKSNENETFKPLKHWGLDIFFLVLGLAVLVISSKLLVSGSVDLAKMLGVSDAIIGLTIIAAGTSMPELATSIVAAFKKQHDISIGNVVGSNIFNILSILGIASLIKPIEAPDIKLFDNLSMIFVSVLMSFLLFTGRKLLRWEGAVLFASYIVYMYFLWPK